MSDEIKVVGNENDGWNVEVAMSGKTVVFACVDEDSANELQKQITATSWFQIETR